jgi:alpha-glucosidase
MADGGYDISDHIEVDPRFGTVADAEALMARAHELGLAVLLDVVPCHTSIEHRWFAEHPDRYVWSPVDGPANNWRAAFGGPAWSADPTGRGWYEHSFYPEQPDLDWRNPAVGEAIGDVLRRWRVRGADGFRLDALDRLLKDPQLRDDPPAAGPAPLPFDPEDAALEHRHSRNAPDIGTGLAALRAAAGDDAYLVGEVYLPAGELGPYLEHLDVAFGFELYHARWESHALRAALEAALAWQGRIAWVTSNHDFSRLANRVGSDRAGRDPFRHPMAWDDSAHGGFTTGVPWLAVTVAPDGPAHEQWNDPTSILRLYRDLIVLRGTLDGDAELVDAAEGVVAFRRGEHLVALNVSGEPQPAPPARRLVRATHDEDGPSPAVLSPGQGFVAVA